MVGFCGRSAGLRPGSNIKLPADDEKHQARKLQAPEKYQASSFKKPARVRWSLVFEDSLEPGCWCLELFPSAVVSESARKIVEPGRRPALHSQFGIFLRVNFISRIHHR